MGQNFDRPLFPKFEALSVGDLHYMIKHCGGGPRPIILCVGPVGKNWPKF